MHWKKIKNPLSVSQIMRGKSKVEIYKFVRYCSKVKRHAWYESSVGLIRKPIVEL